MAASTIPALTQAAAERFPDRLAVSDGATRLTYGELLEASRAFGAALVARGIRPGDRVAIWAFNSAEWIVACLGLFQAGAVLVPINTRFKGPEAAEILARSGARALVAVTDFLGADYLAMLRAAGVALPRLDTVVVAHGEVPDGAESWSDFTARADAGTRVEVRRRCAALGAGDVSDILFTSGTTGVPKGVVMAHGRTLYCGTDWVAMTGLRATDRYLMIPPYFSQFGYKAGILACVAAGAAMLPQAVFNVDSVLRRVQADRVTVLPGPPTLYQSILDHPERDRYDLSSLRVAVTGAADIPVELIRRVHDELPFATVISGYGMTEGGTASSTGPGDPFAAIATTVGRARPGFEIRIVGQDGAGLPGGEIGEILFRGPSTMLGYLDDPDGTRAALSPDGWLRSGDLGLLDSDARLRIVGRIKDMFIVGGFNVYPAEIENVLLRHPAVSRAAVIGVPDARLGEVGMAFVVLRPEAAATNGDGIIAWCRDYMANYKVPRAVEVIAELPLNASGKVEKGVLRARVTG
ncbi:MAG TPA: FadD3 family acyl-CoA ligase [Rugosimonospora sp.]|nr:FadD3 family acyl-CoA ligase [Rugosimonospora sp.]